MVIVKNILKSFINIIFPPTCIVCKHLTDKEDGICFECLGKIDFISNPKCSCCGYPFEVLYPDNKGNTKNYICPRCSLFPPIYNKCLSSVRYNDASKKILLPFKHADKGHYAKVMGKLMATTMMEVKDDIDLIIPVPLHIKRMLKRKYNQSALLATRISNITNKEIAYNVLFRGKFKESQGHLSHNRRKANVFGNFKVKNANLVKGKTVLLIDDVYTTGATVNECAKVLKFAGATKVIVLTFARIVK